ncbi:MAG: hypothetical protein ACTHOD_04305 [Motilibacteraceae bacterium]
MRGPARRTGEVVLALATTRHRLVGLAVLRVAIGATTVLSCLADYGDRRLLWGPHSYLTPDLARAATSGRPGDGSLFLLADSPLSFEVLFHLVIVASIVFTLLGGRLLTVVEAVLLWSLHNRNPDVLQGGDNLAQIVVLLLCCCTTDAYLAPGARARRQRLAAAPPRAATLLHNAGAFLVAFQVCVVYLVAGYWKITGPLWQDGTALYYISRTPRFWTSDLAAALLAHPFLGPLLGTGLCSAITALELAFPFAALSARAWVRRANVLAAALMHLGIAALMGLVCFGLVMVGADAVCLRDADYRTLARRLRAPTAPGAARRLPADVRVRRGAEQRAMGSTPASHR